MMMMNESSIINEHIPHKHAKRYVVTLLDGEGTDGAGSQTDLLFPIE